MQTKIDWTFSVDQSDTMMYFQQTIDKYRWERVNAFIFLAIIWTDGQSLQLKYFPPNLKLMKYKRSTKLFYFLKYFLGEINVLLSFASLLLQAAFLSHSEAAA